MLFLTVLNRIARCKHLCVKSKKNPIYGKRTTPAVLSKKLERFDPPLPPAIVKLVELKSGAVGAQRMSVGSIAD
jgi:hypothetical protein